MTFTRRGLAPCPPGTLPLPLAARVPKTRLPRAPALPGQWLLLKETQLRSLPTFPLFAPDFRNPLALQAYPAPFLFRTSEQSETFSPLFSCAHDWENGNHKDDYEHNDSNHPGVQDKVWEGRDSSRRGLWGRNLGPHQEQTPAAGQLPNPPTCLPMGPE